MPTTTVVVVAARVGVADPIITIITITTWAAVAELPWKAVVVAPLW
jgi:hypothetical protein